MNLTVYDILNSKYYFVGITFAMTGKVLDGSCGAFWYCSVSTLATAMTIVCTIF